MRVDGMIKSHDAIFFMRVDCRDGLVKRHRSSEIPRIAEPADIIELERRAVARGHLPRKVAVRLEHRER